jgi:FtsZ-binding cell division protein ZapB
MQPSTNPDDQTIDITPTAAETIDPKQQRLAVLAEDTRTRMKRSALDIYHIGANLLEAQELLPHGEFLGWIKAEFGMSKSSAYRFIDVGRAFQDKLPILGSLEIAASALYLLASPETPDDARNEALELAAAGETISPKKARKIIEKHASTVRETAALGESLGLPTQGDSVLPASDHIDDLTHVSPADVDDRPGAPPTQPQSAFHNYTVGERITTDYSVKGEVGKIVRVLDTSALVDWGTHRIEIPFERLRPAPAKQPNLPPTSYDHKDENESDFELQSPPNLTSEEAFTPTPAQWQAAQVKHVELLQALRDAQTEIEQLKESRDSLDFECQTLHAKNGELHDEIAHLQGELTALQQQLSPVAKYD